MAAHANLTLALQSLLAVPRVTELLSMDDDRLYRHLELSAKQRPGLSNVWQRHVAEPLRSVGQARKSGNRIHGIPFAHLRDDVVQDDVVAGLLDGLPDEEGHVVLTQPNDIARRLLVTQMPDSETGSSLITNFYAGFGSVLSSIYPVFSWDELQWGLLVTCHLMVKASPSPHANDFPRMISALMITVPDDSDAQPRFLNLRTVLIGADAHPLDLPSGYTPAIRRQPGLFALIRSIWRRQGNIPFAHEPRAMTSSTLPPSQQWLTTPESYKPKWAARKMQFGALHKAIGNSNNRFGTVIKVFNKIKERLHDDPDYWPEALRDARHFDVQEVMALHILSGNCSECPAFERVAKLLHRRPAFLVHGSNFYFTTGLIDEGHSIVQRSMLVNKSMRQLERLKDFTLEHIRRATFDFRTQAAVRMCLLCYLTLAFIRSELDESQDYNYWELVDGEYRLIPFVDFWALAYELDVA